MVDQPLGLSRRELEAIAELERDVVAADGGRLKLEWGRLRARGGERSEDLLWWEGERLLGFLGTYGFGPWLELAGMVAPDARGRGIATALLDAAGPQCRALGYREGLLIVPRHSAAGRRLALRRGATLDHSEHALVLSGPPLGDSPAADVELRPARPADLPVLTQLLELGFGGPAPDGLAARLAGEDESTLMVAHNGAAVGTLRCERDGDTGRIFGFVVDPGWRGHGIGRTALRAACEQLFTAGVRRVGLEVAVDNDRALGLYTSVGFAPVTTEDYFVLSFA